MRFVDAIFFSGSSDVAGCSGCWVTDFSVDFRLFFLVLECCFTSFRDCVSGDEFLEGQFLLGDDELNFALRQSEPNTGRCICFAHEMDPLFMIYFLERGCSCLRDILGFHGDILWR